MGSCQDVERYASRARCEASRNWTPAETACPPNCPPVKNLPLGIQNFDAGADLLVASMRHQDAAAELRPRLERRPEAVERRDTIRKNISGWVELLLRPEGNHLTGGIQDDWIGEKRRLGHRGEQPIARRNAQAGGDAVFRREIDTAHSLE